MTTELKDKVTIVRIDVDKNEALATQMKVECFANNYGLQRQKSSLAKCWLYYRRRIEKTFIEIVWSLEMEVRSNSQNF